MDSVREMNMPMSKSYYYIRFLSENQAFEINISQQNEEKADTKANEHVTISGKTYTVLCQGSNKLDFATFLTSDFSSAGIQL